MNIFPVFDIYCLRKLFVDDETKAVITFECARCNAILYNI